MPKRLFSQVQTDEEVDSKAAIPLSKSQPDLVNGIPISGEDYLLVVRQQAKQCPKTVVAERPKKTKKVELPAHFQMLMEADVDVQLQPSTVWRKGFIKPFKSYQQTMQKQKSKKRKEIGSIEEGYQLLYGSTATTATLPTLSQHSILKLLKFHAQWLEDKSMDIKLTCQQIFNLLVYLDPVLTSKNISILRELSRTLIKIRPSNRSHLGPMNTIITIIADVYGQADLI
ncbi:survival motor neuron interacting protein 1-domain-containing protein [Choanephora cucurbitarum]|nr:survival motor neuron interacting protein 1-domain-containing protein [Choanephora cucurbitarum]